MWHALGFGGCRISLAIPKGDEYTGVEYFRGKRIATSYPAILRRYLEEQGVEAELEVITGSVEIACGGYSRCHLRYSLVGRHARVGTD